MPVRVFISYSHDSEAHRQRVLAFVQALRGHGIDADLDQFHGETIVHWPTWCRQRMDPEHSDFVLCICTAGYRQRINGNVAPEQGRGEAASGRRASAPRPAVRRPQRPRCCPPAH
ncbi:MAG: toll/interleukin-1 receptor domain-containing protein [Plasticicumulans sp.]